MCMDAIVNHIMQQMIASGQIQVPTGVPKMYMMIPCKGLHDAGGKPVDHPNIDQPEVGAWSDSRWVGNIYDPKSAVLIPEGMDSNLQPLAIMNKVHEIMFNERNKVEPNPERSVATDADRLNEADQQK